MMKRVDPAADEAREQAERRRRSASTAAPRRTPTKSEMRAPYISAERMSRPCSSVPSRYLGVPPSIQAGGSTRVAELERRQVERVVRRDDAGEHRAEDADAGDHRRRPSPSASERKLNARRRRRGSAPSGPAPGRPAPPARQVAARRRRAAGQPAGLLRLRLQRDPLEGHVVVRQLHQARPSSLCAQASACWCSGMWPTSSWWILNASRIIVVALLLVGLATGSSASARRASGCCRRRG